MNIKSAKSEICNTIRAYTQKNEKGDYLFPIIRQRPILLIGPPGIGKTAIMEQVAKECGIGLVAYTITHHTRQSAIGLPRIENKIYHGQSYSVTEYTMSEIIASVHECMEQKECKEGILFIDEINCVSETLAPTMLQFLQNKTFGSHRVPKGWIIVAAGNPPEYNKSVREFDIVTLDRVKKIVVEEDCGVWMEYAWQNGVHGSILSYLNIKPDHFYAVENTVDGKFFVTARGWEDLSEILKSYEDLEVAVNEELVIQYLQKAEIAKDFAAYYQLYEKYQTDYSIDEMLKGILSKTEYENKVKLAQGGTFEERFSVIGLVLSRLNVEFFTYREIDINVTLLHQTFLHLKNYLQTQDEMEGMGEFIRERKHIFLVKRQAELISLKDEEREEWILDKLESYFLEIKKERIRDTNLGYERLKAYFQEEVHKRTEVVKLTQDSLHNSFAFIENAFGSDQEMVLFVTGLSKNRVGMEFIQSHGCEAYFEYSKELLFLEKERAIRQEIKKLTEFQDAF